MKLSSVFIHPISSLPSLAPGFAIPLLETEEKQYPRSVCVSGVAYFCEWKFMKECSLSLNKINHMAGWQEDGIRKESKRKRHAKEELLAPDCSLSDRKWMRCARPRRLSGWEYGSATHTHSHRKRHILREQRELALGRNRVGERAFQKIKLLYSETFSN